MQLIGLAGRAGCGKDTVADYLVDTYGFLKFSFSDALYNEVQKAFNLPDQSLLRDRHTKEEPTELLSVASSRDLLFAPAVMTYLEPDPLAWFKPRSPRQILQLWGTEYRRAQDPDYWVKRGEAFINAFLAQPGAEYLAGLVNTSVRFPNELELLHRLGGSVWHIHRADLPPMDNSGHSSEIPLPFTFGVDKEIHNNSTVARLGTGISLLLSSGVNRMVVEDEPKTPAASE